MGTRELVSAPYVVVYRYTEEIVEILYIWHGAQDWRSCRNWRVSADPWPVFDYFRRGPFGAFQKRPTSARQK